MTNNTKTLPLAGIRVIDFTQVMMGPVCTQMLADHGADVIKIERKGAGDLSRSTFAPVAGHDNPIFCSLNRNKRSCEIDLRDPAQVELVKALIADADVVTNNFRAVPFDIFAFYRGMHTYVGIDSLAMDCVAATGQLDAMREGFERGTLKPFPVARAFTLDQALEAYRLVLSGSTDRVVLRP